MRRRTESAAAAAAARAERCQNAFTAIVLPTLAGTLLAVALAWRMTRRRERALAERSRHSYASRLALARLAAARTRGEIAEIVLEAARTILSPGPEPRAPLAVGPDLRIDLPPGRPHPTAEIMLASLADAAGLALQRLDLLERLSQAATTDPLTGLPNRRALLETAPRMLAQARRDGRPIAVAMLDIDNFKRINDVHGHPEGDHVLREIASLLRTGLRACDLVCRWGGEEFALVLPACTPAQAKARLDRLRMATDSIDWAGSPGSISFSAGVAAHEGCENVEHVLRRADAALYQAKASGRDQVVLALPQDGPRET